MYYLLTALALLFAHPIMADSPPLLSKPATKATVAAQKAVLDRLPQEDGRDQRWARQGFIATLEDPISRNEKGEIVYDPHTADWMQGDAPATVNPSLWRHMKLLREHGLFQVTDNVWQVRGLGPTNITIIRGKKGWIVIDPGLTTEASSKARQLIDQHLGKRPITAVIYSHSHVDHFGGILGILDGQAAPAAIVGPENLVEEAGSEWIMVGNIMTRRSMYQWALALPDSATGFVGTGLSVDVPVGSIRLIPPTDHILETGETRTLDGVRFEFQMVPETEAVAEMNVYIPEERVLYIAEFATATMHNIQTPRGAKARDARSWAAYLTESLKLYGDGSDAVIFGHTWPRFGNEEVKNFIALQRDNYKFIHDQTVRLMNRGFTPTEVAENMAPPQAIAQEWSTRGYYGSYKHNAKGVFQYYVGWWDGIPAHLDLLPPLEQAKRYVELAGGPNKVMKAARKAFDKGDYRWSAELLNHLVFARPDHKEAKDLLADSYEQMGYQAESANWRNIYLTGAAELRGVPPYAYWLRSSDLADNMSTESFVDLLATRLNPKKASGRSIKVAMSITDTDENYTMTLKNGVLVGRAAAQTEDSDVSLAGTRNMLRGFFLAQLPLVQMQTAGLQISGDTQALLLLQDAIEPPPADFPIVTP